uniref:Secreted protein n=1 Tax=Setaria digitata TaxID=48799 RepID=A0A915PUB5_9BILA
MTMARRTLLGFMHACMHAAALQKRSAAEKSTQHGDKKVVRCQPILSGDRWRWCGAEQTTSSGQSCPAETTDLTSSSSSISPSLLPLLLPAPHPAPRPYIPHPVPRPRPRQRHQPVKQQRNLLKSITRN